MTSPPAADPRDRNDVASSSPKNEKAVGAITGASGYDDITGLDRSGRHMQHPIVTGRQQNGHGSTAEE